MCITIMISQEVATPYTFCAFVCRWMEANVILKAYFQPGVYLCFHWPQLIKKIKLVDYGFCVIKVILVFLSL